MTSKSSAHEAGRDLVAMAQGFFRGKVLGAAERLGIPDVLAGGPLSNEEVADWLRLSGPVGKRISNSIGRFRTHAPGSSGVMPKRASVSTVAHASSVLFGSR